MPQISRFFTTPLYSFRLSMREVFSRAVPGVSQGDIKSNRQNAWGRTSQSGSKRQVRRCNEASRKRPEYAGQAPLTIAAGKGLIRLREILPVRKDVNPDPGWCCCLVTLLLTAMRDVKIGEDAL